MGYNPQAQGYAGQQRMPGNYQNYQQANMGNPNFPNQGPPQGYPAQNRFPGQGNVFFLLFLFI